MKTTSVFLKTKFSCRSHQCDRQLIAPSIRFKIPEASLILVVFLLKKKRRKKKTQRDPMHRTKKCFCQLSVAHCLSFSATVFICQRLILMKFIKIDCYLLAVCQVCYVHVFRSCTRYCITTCSTYHIYVSSSPFLMLLFRKYRLLGKLLFLCFILFYFILFY